MFNLRQIFQSAKQPKNTSANTHRHQALQLWTLQQGEHFKLSVYYGTPKFF